jgi:putative peptide zinc metalloprotease protein
MAAAGKGMGEGSAPSARGGEALTVLPSSGTMPTEAEPQLALVLTPSDASPANAEGALGDAGGVAGTDTAAPAWVFPFNEPLPPEEGDNQAFATNTSDGSVTYDVAVAMVWVTGNDPVLNVNEAYAFASCADCVTVAVAFQVVVIVGSADVIVPQNLSAAVNYECFECITAAVASQLVVTVDALPGGEQEVALADVWEEILAFAGSIPTLPLADVISELEDYKGRILDILGIAPTVTPSGTPMPSAAATPTATGSPGTSPTATEGPDSDVTAPPAASARPEPAGEVPTVAPTVTPTSSPSPTSTPTPSPTPTP